MVKLEITEDDLSLIESALLVVSGGTGFGHGVKGMRARTLKDVFETTDGLRKLSARMRKALSSEREV